MKSKNKHLNEEDFYHKFHKLIEQDDTESAQRLAQQSKGIKINKDNLKKSVLFIDHNENLVVSRNKLQESNGEFDPFYDISELKGGLFLLLPKNEGLEMEKRRRSFLGEKLFTIAAEAKQPISHFKVIDLPAREKEAAPMKARTLEGKEVLFDMFSTLDDNFDPWFLRNHGDFIKKNASNLNSTKEGMDDFLKMNENLINIVENASGKMSKLRANLVNLIDDPSEYAWVVNKINLITRKDGIYGNSFQSSVTKNEMKIGLLHQVVQRIIEVRERKQPGFKKDILRAFPDTKKLTDKEFYIKTKAGGWVEELIETDSLEKIVNHYLNEELDLFNSFVSGFDLSSMTGEKYWEIIKEGVFKDIKQAHIESRKYSDELFESEKQELDLFIKFILEEWRDNSNAFIEKILRNGDNSTFGAPIRHRPPNILLIIIEVILVLVFVSMLAGIDKKFMEQHAGIKKTQEKNIVKSVSFMKNDNNVMDDLLITGGFTEYSTVTQQLITDTIQVVGGTEGFLEKYSSIDVNGVRTYHTEKLFHDTNEAVRKTEELKNHPEKVAEVTLEDLKNTRKLTNLLGKIEKVRSSHLSFIEEMNACSITETQSINTTAPTLDSTSFVIVLSNPKEAEEYMKINGKAKVYDLKIITEYQRMFQIPLNDFLQIVMDNTRGAPASFSREFASVIRRDIRERTEQTFSKNEERKILVVGGYQDIATPIQFDATVLSQIEGKDDEFARFLLRKSEVADPNISRTEQLHFSPSEVHSYINYLNFQSGVDALYEGYRTPSNSLTSVFDVSLDYSGRIFHHINAETFWAYTALLETLDGTRELFSMASSSIFHGLRNFFGLERTMPWSLDAATLGQVITEETYGNLYHTLYIDLMIILLESSPFIIQSMLEPIILRMNPYRQRGEVSRFINGLIRPASSALRLYGLRDTLRISLFTTIYFWRSMPNAGDVVRVIANSFTLSNQIATLFGATLFPGITLSVFWGLSRSARWVFKILGKLIPRKMFLKEEVEKQQQPKKEGKKEKGDEEPVEEIPRISFFSKDFIYLGVMTNYSYLLNWIISELLGEKGRKSIIDQIGEHFEKNKGTLNKSLRLSIQKRFRYIRDATEQIQIHLVEIEETKYLDHIIYSIYLAVKTNSRELIFPSNNPYIRARSLGRIIFPYIYNSFESFRKTGELLIARKLVTQTDLNINENIYDVYFELLVRSDIHKVFIENAANIYKFTVQSSLVSISSIVEKLYNTRMHVHPITYLTLMSPVPYITTTLAFITYSNYFGTGSTFKDFFNAFFSETYTKALTIENWSIGYTKGSQVLSTLAFAILIGNQFRGENFLSLSGQQQLRLGHVQTASLITHTYTSTISNIDNFKIHLTDDHSLLGPTVDWKKVEHFVKEVYLHSTAITPEDLLKPSRSTWNILHGISSVFVNYYYHNTDRMLKSIEATLNDEHYLRLIDSKEQLGLDAAYFLEVYPDIYFRARRVEYSVKMNTLLTLKETSEKITQAIRSITITNPMERQTSAMAISRERRQGMEAQQQLYETSVVSPSSLLGVGLFPVMGHIFRHTLLQLSRPSMLEESLFLSSAITGFQYMFPGQLQQPATSSIEAAASIYNEGFFSRLDSYTTSPTFNITDLGPTEREQLRQTLLNYDRGFRSYAETQPLIEARFDFGIGREPRFLNTTSNVFEIANESYRRLMDVIIPLQRRYIVNQGIMDEVLRVVQKEMEQEEQREINKNLNQ